MSPDQPVTGHRDFSRCRPWHVIGVGILGFLTTLMCLRAKGVFMVAQDVVSNLKSDERIVFFTTDASLSEDGTMWTVPIHAWVHEKERASIRRAAISAALNARYSLRTNAATEDNFRRRVSLIVADNERGKRIVVALAGNRFTLPETEANGHAVGMFQVAADKISINGLRSELAFHALLPEGDERSFRGTVRFLSPKGVSVISDFDDTVKVSHATDRTLLLDHALFQDYQAVDGMAQRYSSWDRSGVPIHFVSSSPWHLYEPIDEFLDAHGFPNRSLSLKGFRFTDSTLMNLFKKGTETKPAQIRPILDAYPHRKFVLIGDSGEQDPEVYAAIMRAFPKQISRIFIRNVTNASTTDERFSEAFDGIDADRWSLFDQPSELTLPEL